MLLSVSLCFRSLPGQLVKSKKGQKEKIEEISMKFGTLSSPPFFQHTTPEMSGNQE